MLNMSIFLFTVHYQEVNTLNKLRKSMEGLINIKNKNNKWFLWCHIKTLKSVKNTS